MEYNINCSENTSPNIFSLFVLYFSMLARLYCFEGEAVEVFVSVRLVLYVSSAECIGELERCNKKLCYICHVYIYRRE